MFPGVKEDGASPLLLGFSSFAFVQEDSAPNSRRAAPKKRNFFFIRLRFLRFEYKRKGRGLFPEKPVTGCDK